MNDFNTYLFFQVSFKGIHMERKSPLHLNTEQFFHDIAGISIFSMRYFGNLFRSRFETREFLNQCFKVGLQSLLLISITAIILGLVLTIQIRPIVADLGAEAWLPNLVFISVVTELGPVIIALLFAGKVGSGIGAELSSMRVTEQIDAMEVSATNPFNFLVVSIRVRYCVIYLSRGIYLVYRIYKILSSDYT